MYSLHIYLGVILSVFGGCQLLKLFETLRVEKYSNLKKTVYLVLEGVFEDFNCNNYRVMSVQLDLKLKPAACYLYEQDMQYSR